LKPSGTLWFEVDADKSAEPKETPLLSIARRSLDGANVMGVCAAIWGIGRAGAACGAKPATTLSINN